MASSLRDQVNQLLTEYADLVRRYFQSLSAVAENAPVEDNLESLVERIAALDAQLQVAAGQIEEHQERQQQIIQVQEDIQEHHVALLRLVQRLDDAREELDKDLNQANRELKAAQYARDANVQCTDVISYAAKLSKYTSAPPNFDLMNRDIKVDFEKPYPDEQRMKRGLLYRQHTTDRAQDDRIESSESESSADEDVKRETAATEDAQGDPFWILDLNPDLPS
ncbi:hypothetical protein DFQ28_002843 [Apophysomyces sp. BC1034]|nr:hypothetical protein DFQ30_005282 [Apophysomyces sp. BC1015]KAG0179407.1 hypothetical protein DFQ29_002128 [Apophysomyces sp. BC1021]KAG0189832.1 hypothetical protein DFQ28_002843 [Apophysomyces sp. BC1034]